MKSRQEILTILGEHKPELTRRFRVQGLALFGSYARGDQRPESDVDILVDVDPSIGLQFVSLAKTIEDTLGLPVDLVSRRAITPRHWEVIRPEIIDV
jgi:predicted nucleotidyltransferase